MPVVWDATDSDSSSSPEHGSLKVGKLSKQGTQDFLTNPSMIDDEDEILRSWQIFTKMKNVVQNGNRYENASWRRWYQKRNGIKTSSFAEADSFKQYADDSVFKVLSKFDKTNNLKEILDKSLDGSDIPASPPSPSSDSTISSIETTKTQKRSRKRNTLKGLGLETGSHDYELSEEEETENETESLHTEDDEDVCHATGIILSPPTQKRSSKKKGKKSVRFDESLNQTTFVRYTPDTWITGYSENVDEYCKLERRKRGLLLFEDEDEETKTPIEENSFEASANQKELAKKDDLSKKDSHENFLFYLDTALTLVFELGSFVQWCRAVLFR